MVGATELHGLASCVDYLTGFSAAYAIALCTARRHQALIKGAGKNLPGSGRPIGSSTLYAQTK